MHSFNKKLIKSVLGFVVALLFALTPALFVVQAGTTTEGQCDKLKQQFDDFTQSSDGGAPAALTGNCYSPGGLINRGVVIGFTFAGGIAVLFIIIGGLQYMTSAGNESQAEKGKKTLKWAAIGLAVIILAATIVTVVSEFIVGR